MWNEVFVIGCATVAAIVHCGSTPYKNISPHTHTHVNHCGCPRYIHSDTQWCKNLCHSVVATVAYVLLTCLPISIKINIFCCLKLSTKNKIYNHFQFNSVQSFFCSHLETWLTVTDRLSRNHPQKQYKKNNIKCVTLIMQIFPLVCITCEEWIKTKYIQLINILYLIGICCAMGTKLFFNLSQLFSFSVINIYALACPYISNMMLLCF